MSVTGEHAYISEIVQHISDQLGDTLDVSSISWVTRPKGKGKISDATLALYIDGKHRKDDVVLLLSNPHFQDVVDEDVQKAQQIAETLQPDTAARIARPIYTHRHANQSYAVFNRLDPLSDKRLTKYVHKTASFQKVASWLLDVAEQSQTPRTTAAAVHEWFLRPLEVLLFDSDMPDHIQSLVKDFVPIANAKGAGLFTTAEHGDFWSGNVLYHRKWSPTLSPIFGDFRVIDWGGSNPDGYPCCDLLRYCLSLNNPSSTLSNRAIRAYTSKLGISDAQFGLYLFASLGRLAMNLDQFPKARFIILCQRYYDFLKQHQFIAAP